MIFLPQIFTNYNEGIINHKLRKFSQIYFVTLCVKEKGLP